MRKITTSRINVVFNAAIRDAFSAIHDDVLKENEIAEMHEFIAKEAISTRFIPIKFKIKLIQCNSEQQANLIEMEESMRSSTPHPQSEKQNIWFAKTIYLKWE